MITLFFNFLFMKKLAIFASLFLLYWTSYASVVDNSIIDELNSLKTQELNVDFKMKSFNSCLDMQVVLGDYVKKYWEYNKGSFYPYRWGWIIMPDIMFMEDDILWSVNSESIVEKTSSSTDANFSETNTQVKWVDEADIIKTDWKYIYYYNSKDKFIYIVWVNDKKIIKKIKTPSNFYNPELYIWNDTLTIISNWYVDVDYSRLWHWIDRNSKTFVIVYDLKDINSPKLEKLYISDWNVSQTRKIGDYVYVVSTNYFNIPYYSFSSVDDINFSLNKVMPKSIDVSRTNVENQKNLVVSWEKTSYNVTSWNVSNCNNIQYVLPDDETLKNYEFTPSYNIVSIIDTKNPNAKVKTQVIAWNTSEIHMSLDNLYITSHMYKWYDFTCAPNERCFAPWYPRGVNTLIHKLNIDKLNISYQDSTIVPWSPLTQYSMDEHEWNFRILTQTSRWNNVENESYTDLYILDKNLNLKWSLTRLWEWEEFKSSRYIWDKLFLVTFEQIDPLFVIDVKDASNPKVLWELKMPGYSTYLHPYDENHLIGLGYDTVENQWGWINNAWVKVDLYEINYDKKCGDSNLTSEEKSKCDSWDYKWIIVKQKYTKSFGDMWSYSEALNNPRMFMWNSKENKLFLPVTLYKKDSEDTYRNIDFFQWLLTLDINKNSWINESYRISHIDTAWLEEKRIEECSKYTSQWKERCYTLIDWTRYCEPTYHYVPKYCVKDSTIWEYIASKNWEFRDSFINRALWIWNQSYAISNDKISIHNILNWTQNYSIELK